MSGPGERPAPLSVLYRGPLSSCNYGCHYCPFAKHEESEAELAVDERALARFVAWVERERAESFGVLFTPWGEALTRAWYREALVRLSHLPQVRRVAIQTNLSSSLDWLARAERDTLALWATYHPEWTSRARFLKQVRLCVDLGVRVSVGAVGRNELRDDIAALRRELPDGVYLWVNAVKDSGPGYYDDAVRAFFERIDPLFPINNERHASLGRACAAGSTSFTVDGEGTMRRCHFIGAPIGRIDDARWREALAPRPCSNDTCGCHIGYVNLHHLRLGPVFGEGLLERIPADEKLWRRTNENA